MPTPLPERPRLEQLRKQARELQRAGRTGDPGALRLLGLSGAHPGLTLAVAQRAIAGRHGFASWVRLKAHVTEIEARTWSLQRDRAGEGPAGRFLRLACVTYSGTDPDPAAAHSVLEESTGLARADLAVAAACGDVDAVHAHLAAGARVDAGTGALGWPPLMYLTYSRVDVGAAQAVATARALLDAGADPDAGRYFLGYPTPFTALTGVFGGGEHGEPPHPTMRELATVLLEAGADPNDAQTLYNRQFGHADDAIELLLTYGLGTGDGGPWRRRLPDLTPPPDELVRRLLAWAVTHDQQDRVGLLAAHGVDLASPLPTGSVAAGQRPVDAALASGHRALAGLLQRLGAGEPTLEPVEALIGAVLAGDAGAVAGTPDEVVGWARAARPSLVVWAAGLPDRGAATAAVELALDLGFDVDARGRSDVPVEQPWQTALHTAVERDDASLVQLLLRRGADPTITDTRFGATPAAWAGHLGRPEIASLLAFDPSTDAGDPG